MNDRLHLLLIGIDYYLPPQSPFDYYPCLSGSVEDINDVEHFFTRELCLAPERIVKLTATCGTEGVLEPRERWPTYENIVEAFLVICREASPGDQVYIHFSGHGGRTPTLYPEKKGVRGLDGSLVPCNIGDPRARHLRDPELALLLGRMVERGLFVTIVLDCCHGGGGGAWRDQRGYVLLTASRPQEVAFELQAEDDGKSRGVLTRSLLEILRAGGTSGTWQEIYDVVFCRVHYQFPSQSPILIGEKLRTFLGNEVVDPPGPSRDFRVLGGEGVWFLLGAGAAVGVCEGMQFSVHSPTFYREEVEEKCPVVEVVKIGATECLAKVVRELVSETPGAGSRARPLGGVAIQRPAVCRFISNQSKVFDRIERTLRQDGAGALKWAESEEAADLQIGVNECGEYVVSRGIGEPLSNLGPPLVVDIPGIERILLSRLIHLARFFDLERHENDDRRSPLKGKLHLEVLRVETRFGGEELQPGADMHGPFEVRCGESLVINVENRSARTLNVVVLNFQPDWGIEQIFPSKRDAEFWPLDPGEKTTVCICGYLPAGIAESREVIKAFATVGVPNFLWREMQPISKSAPSKCPPTEQVCEPWVTCTPRGVVPDEVIDSIPLAVGDFPGRDWTTAQIEVLVRR